MKSKTMISSSKSLERASINMINNKCKKDHFSYTKDLPVKKNLSSYTSAYKDINIKEYMENSRIEEFRRKIAPPSLNANLLKRSLHESTSHFSPSKVAPLPSLNIGTNYKENFIEKENQKIVKGKQQEGFFIKMPWHDSPSSNYRVRFYLSKKSYDSSNRDAGSLEKGKAVQDHIKLIKKHFKGQSVYEECYTPLRKSGHNNSKDCIKNKDHISGVQVPLKGQSEYRSRYEKSVNKENQESSKVIKSKKKLSLLPQISKKRSYEGDEKIPKKSTKMKKTQSNTVTEDASNQTTHSRIFGEVEQN